MSEAVLSVRAGARWILPAAADAIQRNLQTALSLHPVVAAILAARGYVGPDEARRFLNPQISEMHDPLLMRDMDRAVERIHTAIRARELILLYGDYDVDGTSAIVVLMKVLELLSARVQFHVPHRLREGYGMRPEIIDRAKAEGVGLIISVDTGIRASAVVEHANGLGVDVIVTDHHLPEDALPRAYAVLNPNRPDCRYPNKHLCGAGVAFKLVHAVLLASGLPEAKRAVLLDSFLKPVAIATVADIVPLTGENRVIVQRGLSGFNRVRNPGLRSLLEVAGFDEGECPSAHQVAFRVAPRINAAGRMADARDVIELFLTNNVDRARVLATQLDTLNRERQQTEAEIVEQIISECAASAAQTMDHGLLFVGQNWHPGVLGIVASRLVERFSRPVFVLSDSTVEGCGEGLLSGSGRSIPAFHLLDALESMPHLFTRFGGHRQAAGVTMHAHNALEFKARFAECAGARLCAEDLRPQYTIDAAATFGVLTPLCIEQILSLGPFGFGNAQPTLLAEDVEVAGPPRVIREGKHYSFPLRSEGRMLWCKGWNFGERAPLLQPGSKVDVLFQVEDDPYSQ